MALLAVMVGLGPATGRRRWGRRGPVFLVAGTQVNVEAAIPV